MDTWKSQMLSLAFASICSTMLLTTDNATAQGELNEEFENFVLQPWEQSVSMGSYLDSESVRHGQGPGLIVDHLQLSSQGHSLYWYNADTPLDFPSKSMGGAGGFIADFVEPVRPVRAIRFQKRNPYGLPYTIPWVSFHIIGQAVRIYYDWETEDDQWLYYEHPQGFWRFVMHGPNAILDNLQAIPLSSTCAPRTAEIQSGTFIGMIPGTNPPEYVARCYGADGTGTGEDVLLTPPLEDDDGNRVEYWCSKGDDGQFGYYLYFLPASGGRVLVGRCGFCNGRNPGGGIVWHTGENNPNGYRFVSITYSSTGDGNGDQTCDYDNYESWVSYSYVVDCDERPRARAIYENAPSQQLVPPAPLLVHRDFLPSGLDDPLPAPQSFPPGGFMSVDPHPFCDLDGDADCDTEDLGLLEASLGLCLGLPDFRPDYDIDGDACITESDRTILFGVSTGISEPPSSQRRTYELAANVPNPFNPNTEISFSLPRERVVRLRVYDAGGRLVKTLHEGPAAAGRSSYTWNGTNEDNRSVPSGIYFYELDAGTDRETRRMVLLR